MRFYLINPKIQRALQSWELAAQMTFKRGGSPPLGLLTVAAMIPSPHEVEVCDENNEKVNFDIACDYVCLTGMHLQKHRIIEIAQAFKKRGIKTILGGPSVMATPDDYTPYIDICVIGEAEHIWPQCLSDIENGCAKAIYQTDTKPELSETPIPRFDLLPIHKYITATIQTTRGCPFLCEFCDIITLYGRRPRVKPVNQVLKEIQTVVELGASNITFTDDNFIGDPRYTKVLLTELNDWLSNTNNKISYHLQATINLAKNKELLELLAKTGCKSIFFGIESPSVESLRETGKVQNLKNDMIEDLKIIRSYGIMIMAGMVVGFDHDDANIFERQLQFVNDANIPSPLNNILGALPGTPLYDRLKKSGRLLDDNFKLDAYYTNIVPTNMSRKELYEGFTWLNQQTYHPDNYYKRCLNEITELEQSHRPPKHSSLLMLMALGWILAWYCADKHRAPLLRLYVKLVPKVLLNHPRSLNQLVEYLLRYRHVQHILVDIQNSYQEELNALSDNSIRHDREPAGSGDKLIGSDHL